MVLEFEKGEAEEVPVPKVENLETIPIPREYLALKVLVVLKGIFRHLSDSELGNARLVNRQWNFAAMSELVSRRRQLSTIKLRGYGWFLEFENKRRSLWIDLYGDDCPMLEFRHLHFVYPEKTQAFIKLFRSPWLSSVTSLTLSMYSETFEELLLDWFLPSLPNLQNLSCTIKPEVQLDQDRFHDSRSNSYLEVGLLEPKPERQDLQINSKLHSFSVCFEEAYRFPWNLIGSFPRLVDLKLEFADAATLIECAEGKTPTALCDIEALQIILTHKPNLKEQIENAELNAEAFTTAAAKLSNQFRVTQSLNAISIIPAAVAGQIETIERVCMYSPVPNLRDAHWHRKIVFYISSWFQGIVELDVQVTGWQDCVEIIDIAGTTLKCVKKLALRGMVGVCEQRLSLMYFFPEVDRPRFPTKWFKGRKVSRQYEGLPGIQSLKVFRLEQFGIRYHPTAASEIVQKMPILKLIHLDDQFNKVVSVAFSYSQYQSVYKEFLLRGTVREFAVSESNVRMAIIHRPCENSDQRWPFSDLLNFKSKNLTLWLTSLE